MNMLLTVSLFLAEAVESTEGSMNTFNMVWSYVQPIVTSATFGTIFTAIVVGILRGTISKKFAKINFDERFSQMADMAFERLQGMTFKHDIEPLVESHLAKIKQELTLETKEEIEQVKHLVLLETTLIGNFAAFFNNSAAIPQEVRDEFAKTLAEIQSFEKSTEPLVIESTPIIEDKKDKHKKKEVER